MKMKTTIKIMSALYLLPGLLFDLCMGIGFVLNDGRPDHHVGDFIAQFACDQMDALPNWLGISLLPSLAICALPTGAIVLGFILITIIGTVYFIINLGMAILNMPFSGKFEWGLFDKN